MEFDAAQMFQLATDLQKVPSKAIPLASKVVRKTAKDIEGTAKSIAPVDTGNLKNSIGSQDVGPLEAEVRATANYAVYLETGTSRMAAQPFMGPAADKHTPAFSDAMAQIIGGAL